MARGKIFARASRSAGQMRNEIVGALEAFILRSLYPSVSNTIPDCLHVTRLTSAGPRRLTTRSIRGRPSHRRDVSPASNPKRARKNFERTTGSSRFKRSAFHFFPGCVATFRSLSISCFMYAFIALSHQATIPSRTHDISPTSFLISPREAARNRTTRIRTGNSIADDSSNRIRRR